MPYTSGQEYDEGPLREENARLRSDLADALEAVRVLRGACESARDDLGPAPYGARYDAMQRVVAALTATAKYTEQGETT